MKNKKLLWIGGGVLIIIGALCAIFFFKAPEDVFAPPLHQDISPEIAYEQLKADDSIILLDVRTAEEYEQSRIPGSILVPSEVLEQEIEKVIPDKESTIYVYCRGGKRSDLSSEKLVEMGYKNVYDMGGIIQRPYEIEYPQSGSGALVADPMISNGSGKDNTSEIGEKDGMNETIMKNEEENGEENMMSIIGIE